MQINQVSKYTVWFKINNFENINQYTSIVILQKVWTWLKHLGAQWCHCNTYVFDMIYWQLQSAIAGTWHESGKPIMEAFTGRQTCRRLYDAFEMLHIKDGMQPSKIS